MIGQLLLILIGSYTRRYYDEFPMWGIGFFGVEPESPRPPLPHAPPFHPCPYERDVPNHPFQ